MFFILLFYIIFKSHTFIHIDIKTLYRKIFLILNITIINISSISIRYNLFDKIHLQMLLTNIILFLDSTSKSSDLRLVVVSNGVAILPCESRADAASVVQYTWTKDNLPIDVGSDGRIQITNEGHLLLKDAMEEDSGVYVCQAASNNDIIEVNVTLIVLGE